MTAAAIRAALQCGRPRCRCADGRATHCPAHEDANPSLGVDQVGHRTLVHCRAGCRQSAVIDALRSLGLWNSSAVRSGGAEPTTVQLAIAMARSEPWMRAGIVEIYGINDAIRRRRRRADVLRRAVTREGDTPSAWEAAAVAAACDLDAERIEAALEEAWR